MQVERRSARRRRGWRRIGGICCVFLIMAAIVLWIWGTDRAPADGDRQIAAADGTGEPDGSAVPQVGSSARQLAMKDAFASEFHTNTPVQMIPEVSKKALDKKLTTEYVVLYDCTHAQILYSKNASERCYPASTTKLLTACVAAKFCAPDTAFTVGEELSLVAYDSSLALLKKGQRLTFEMLLDALLLPSGNDAAYVMAAGVGRIYAGDESLSAEDAVAVFVELMNQTAKRIGAEDSHFVTPDGYHDDDHYTTAMDMMRIALYASSFDAIRASYGKSEVSYTLLSGEDYYWENSNPLIDSTSACFYSYANGMKTGFTDQAGSCLVASAKKDDVELIAVAMNGRSIDARNQDLTAMFEMAFEACETEEPRAAS